MDPHDLDDTAADGEHLPLAAEDLCRRVGLSLEEFDELIGYGALTAESGATAQAGFSTIHLHRLRAAIALRRDYDVDLFTVALAMGYLQRIDALESELRALRARLGGLAVG